MLEAIVLASGFGKRMRKDIEHNTDKLLLKIDGISMAEISINLLIEQNFKKIHFVTRKEIASEIHHKGVNIIINENAEEGKSNSIKLGVTACDKWSDLMFFVADQPLLSGEVIEKLINIHESSKDSIIAPIVDGNLANPNIFPAKFRDELLNLTGDEGGKKIIKKYRNSVKLLETDDRLSFMDVDTVQDYQEIIRLKR